MNTGRTKGDLALEIGWPVLLAGLALVANGYRFNSSDQAIHLTLLRRLLEPQLMTRDLVAMHGEAHASLWWHLQVPLVRLLGWDQLPWLYLLLYFVALVATFALLHRLGRELLGDGRAALLAPALLVVFKVCPGHVHTFEPELINRTATHPLLLWCMLLLLRGRPVKALAICGLAFNLHASTAVHVAVALTAAAILDPELRRRLPAMVGAFAVCAAPLVAIGALRGGEIDWWVDPEWMQVLRWRLPHHLFPWRWPAGLWLAAGFQLTLWFAAARHIADPVMRRRGHGMVVGVLVCGPLLGTLVAGPAPIAPLLALHLWESWIVLAVLAYVAAAGLVTAWFEKPRWTTRVASVLLCVVLLAGVESRISGWRREPVLQVRGPTGDDRELLDALSEAAVPPGSTLLVQPDRLAWLRPWSGRSLFVTVKDGGEAVFDRDLALAWRDRLAEQCGRDLLADPPPRGEWLGYRSVGERAARAFADVDDQHLCRLALDHRAWLLVVPADVPRPGLAPTWQNAGYIIYDLRQPLPGRRGELPDQPD